MAIIEVQVTGATWRVHHDPTVRYGEFWTAFSAGTFEPATVAVLREHLGPGRRFLDVGAWIGPFSLLAAALGASVVAVEADPVAVRDLTANVALNAELAERIDVRPVALAARPGRVRIDGGDHGLGNGLSRMTLEPEPAVDQGTTVDAVDAATLDVGSFDVIKIDIEGAEFSVIPTMAAALRAAQPVLLLSLHGPEPTGPRWRSAAARFRHAPARLRLLWSLRAYPKVSRISSHRDLTIVGLGRAGRFLLAFRLGEAELLCCR